MRALLQMAIALALLSTTACGVLSSTRHASDSLEATPVARATARNFLPTKSASLEALPAPDPVIPAIELRDTPEIRAMLHRYTKMQRGFFADGAKRGEPYIPLMAAVLREHELPFELVNVAFIESRFQSDAKSHQGAVGMWQFMKSTARLYGLEVSMWKDERTDPRRSTQAAARFLKDLHEDFEDWLLAIAAYNAGPAKIKKAIESCGTRDFFALRECGDLRKETLDFVAKFVAITLIGRHPDAYGFESELGTKLVRRLKMRARRRV